MINTMEQTMLQHIAWQKLMREPVYATERACIYRVRDGWPLKQVMNDENICIISNALEFESAMQNPEIHALYVPHEAAITQEIVERILARNPFEKAIFWGVSQ